MEISPVLPLNWLIAYSVISAFALLLCLWAFPAILRSKKTPYPTKLLSLGLLAYDSLFIISSNVSKLFRHEENFAFRQLSRGFQVAGSLIVVFMAFERLFVLNWPYRFLRVGTRGRIRNVCIPIIILCFLQYVLFQGLICYTRGKVYGCGFELAIYYLVLALVGYTSAIGSYIKVFSIIRNKSLGLGMVSQRENKGTYTSFVFLVSNVILGCAYVAIASYFTLLATSGNKLTGQVMNIVDAVYLLNSIIIPHIEFLCKTSIGPQVLISTITLR